MEGFISRPSELYQHYAYVDAAPPILELMFSLMTWQCMDCACYGPKRDEAGTGIILSARTAPQLGCATALYQSNMAEILKKAITQTPLVAAHSLGHRGSLCHSPGANPEIELRLYILF